MGDFLPFYLQSNPGVGEQGGGQGQPPLPPHTLPVTLSARACNQQAQRPPGEGAAPSSRKYLPVPKGFPTTHPPAPGGRVGTPLPLTPRLGVTALRSALLLLNAHQASDIESVPAGIPQRGKEVVKQHFIHHYLFFFFFLKK